MICKRELEQFISILASEENTFLVAQRAFEALDESYHLGEVRYCFQTENTAFTHGKAEKEGVLYHAAQTAAKEPEIIRDFHTGEQGNLRLIVVNQLQKEAWNEEETNDLHVILNVLAFHLGRCYLTQQAQENAMTDFVTGLLNADGYIRYVADLFGRHELSKYNAYYFNLKRFGLINHKFGQKETDEIICRYAAILQQFINGEEVIGRLGGDNFVALLRKERTQEFLNLIAGVETFGMIAEDKLPIVIRAVAGVFEIKDTLQNYEAVISEPEMALNVAKNISKKAVVFASEELEGRVYRQSQIAEKFPEALEKEEFVVYYQPKVETNTYQMAGAEALARWISNGKMISPGEFVPVIEREGSICKLDFYMLEHVCKDVHEWIEEGLAPVRISVNFSRKNLTNPHLTEDILAILQKYQVPVEYIEIEVTETTDEEDQGMLNQFMNEMQSHHIALAIDDFGTGYSSLNLLRSFPVDVLKIDRSFIVDEDISQNDEIILENIVKMAKELSMDVVTEGVEYWEQVEFLRNIECNMVQGFLFDRPMPQQEFEKKLQMKQYDITKLKSR